MLIVNDEQRLRAGIASLSKRCSYCTKALAAYPLIMSDEARLQVYHAACAAALVSGGSRDHFSTEAVPKQGLRPGRSNKMKSQGFSKVEGVKKTSPSGRMKDVKNYFHSRRDS